MTVDEELERLEHDLRRLKIEYEIYLNGNSKQPPNDIAFRVQTAINRFAAENARLSYRQRFKFNQLVQRHAVQNDLLRRKLKNKEEGRTALASRVGWRGEYVAPPPSFEAEISDLQTGDDKITRFMEAITAARRQAGEPEPSDPQTLSDYVRQSVKKLKEAGCGTVKLSVGIEDRRVRFQVVKGS